jgi:cytochrome c-type biogenesis protein CcmH/NrfF
LTPPNVRKAQQIARQTMSPFCPGRTLSDCPSEYATEWRHDIQKMVDKGMSAAEIQAELERRAGGDLSGNPRRSTGYVLPVGLSAGAILLLFGILRYVGGKREEEQTSPKRALAEGEAPPEASPALDERLEHELEEEDDEDKD